MKPQKKLKITLKNQEKDKKGTTYYKILHEDVLPFMKYQNEISNKLDADGKKTFNKLLDIFVSVDMEEENRARAIFNEMHKKVADRFFNDKEYKFKYINRKIPRTYTLEIMVLGAMQEALYRHLHNSLDKEDCLTICYGFMHQYVQRLNKPNQQFMQFYKLCSLSGYIAYLMGHTNLSKLVREATKTGENITNQEFFIAVRYHCEKVMNMEIEKGKQ